MSLIYSEHMVLDSYDKGWFDDLFYSADMTLPFRLAVKGSAHPAWDLGVYAAQHQMKNAHNFSAYSQLCQDQGRAYLQGHFVNDAEHGLKVELHPLDSIAFAMCEHGKTISSKFGESGWPTNYVRWRVAFFTNSNIHRINSCASWLQKERTTIWYLAMPGNAYGKQENDLTGKVRWGVVPQRLWNGARSEWYESAGVKTYAKSALAKDPRDGITKLKVTVTMNKPDNFGAGGRTH